MATKFSFKKCLDANDHFNVAKAKKYLEEIGVDPTKDTLAFIKENRKLPPAPKVEEPEEPAEEPEAPTEEPAVEEPEAPVEEPKKEEPHVHKSRYTGHPGHVDVPAAIPSIPFVQKSETVRIDTNKFKVNTVPGSPVPPAFRPINAPSNQFSVPTTGVSATTIPASVTSKVAQVMSDPIKHGVRSIEDRKAEVHYRESGDSQKNCANCKKFVPEATAGNVKETYPCRLLGCHVAKTTVCDQFGGK